MHPLLRPLLPVLERFAVNRAVAYLLAARLWQFLTGFVTIVLISRFFSPGIQGYYYVFASYLALQAFVELGLPTIVLLMASHEWAHLSLDETRCPHGSPIALSRLASLCQIASVWFSCCAVLFAIVAVQAGWLLINDPQFPDIPWRGPWVAAVSVNAISMTYLPKLALLEGCNQVAEVNRVRLWQGVTGSLAVWGCIAGGAELWTVAVSNAVRLGWEAGLVHVSYRRFFSTLRRVPIVERIDWKEEIWPLQWRLIPQSIGGWFATSFFTIAVDRGAGRVASGRMGMTWSVLSALQSASLAWVQTRTPEFGMLVARREFAMLDQRTWKIGRIAVAVFLSGGGAFWLLLLGLAAWWPQVSDRFLSATTTGVLILGLAALLAAMVEHAYIRAHKRDPLMILNTLSAALSAGIIWTGGVSYGAWGACAGYALFCWVYTLPLSTLILIWFRRRYHAAVRNGRS